MIRELSDAEVLTFVLAGCNAREIAAYAGVSVACAHALMAHALNLYAKAKA